MFHFIYIENRIQNHPRTQQLLKRFAHLPHIFCDRYQEVFNRKTQNFRLQKQIPALILAEKKGNLLLKTPEGYGIGGKNNYYFSHMMNCVYDCRYCFLQGMYDSSHLVLFVNFEDFQEAIRKKISEYSNEPLHFFSGYDCDSLALESISHFAESFLPFFEQQPRAFLELRTKSTQVRPLLQSNPLSNCIVAFTLTPAPLAKALEHKAPSLESRLEALEKLQNKGWKIGLRFDPLIYCNDYQNLYRHFFSEVFSKISVPSLHSVTMGTFRLPLPFFKKMSKLYPDEKLFVHSLEETDDAISYQKPLSNEMQSYCREEILKYIPHQLLFSQEAL